MNRSFFLVIAGAFLLAVLSLSVEVFPHDCLSQFQNISNRAAASEQLISKSSELQQLKGALFVSDGGKSSNMVLDSCNVLQEDTSRVSQGLTKQVLLHIIVYTSDSANPLTLSVFYLSTSGTSSTADIVSAGIWYTGQQAVFADTSIFGQAVAPSGQFSIIGSQMLFPGANHFWLTYDISINAADGNVVDGGCDSATAGGVTVFPPVSYPSGDREILRTLSGSYTIGQGGSADYSSFAAAVADLEYRGISGPVIMNAESGTYTERIWFHAISGTSAINTVTFQSSASDSTAVVLQYNSTATSSNYVIRLQAVKHLNLNQITIKSLNSGYCRAIELFDMNDSVNISNCVVEGPVITGVTYSVNRALFYSANNYYNQNINIGQCRFVNGGTGVLFVSPNLSSGVNIMNNHFEGQYHYGISVYRLYNHSISNNYIAAGGDYNFYNGIAMTYCSGPSLISKNYITITHTGSVSGIFLNNCSCDVTGRGQISNNFISAATGGETSGILMETSQNYDIINNTVFVTGSSTGSRCYYQNAGSAYLRNNVFANMARGFTMVFNNFSAGIDADYNVFYSNGDWIISRLANYSSLTAWQAASGMDQNSVASYPGIDDVLDPHVFSAVLDGAGTPIALITDDIYGVTRNAQHPDPGCVEFTAPAKELMVAGFISPVSECGTAKEEVILRVMNLGSDSIAEVVTAAYKLNGISTYTASALQLNLAPQGFADLILPDSADLRGYTQDTVFSFTAYVKLSGDQHPLNDTATNTIAAGFQPPSPGVTDITVAGGDTAVLTAVSDYMVFWYENDTSGDYIGGSSTFSIQLFDSSVFYAAASGTVSHLLNTSFSSSYTVRGFMFNLLNDTDSDLQIDSLAINVVGTLNHSIDIYYKEGNYVGFNSDPSAWTYLATRAIKGAGTGKPTHLDIGGLFIPAHSGYSIYLHCSSSVLRVGSGTTVYNDDYLSVLSTGSLSAEFGTISLNRRFNGNIYYSTSTGCMSARSPLQVAVNGTPGIMLSDTSLSFISQSTSDTITDTIIISNPGNYSLFISNIQVSGNAFFTDLSTMKVIPGIPGKLPVHFISPFTGSFTGDILLQSNAGDRHISLNGNVVNQNVIIYPDSLLVYINQCVDSVNRNLIIKNTGIDPVSFEFIGNYGFDLSDGAGEPYTIAGQTISNTFSQLNKNADSLWLDIQVKGDYDEANETVTLFIDGTQVDVISPMGFWGEYSYSFGGAQVKTWLADSTLLVELVNSATVDPLPGNSYNAIYLYFHGITWLEPSVDTGTILSGDSASVSVEFNSKGLMAGQYKASLHLTTSDPLLPVNDIECTMILNGTPDLRVDDLLVITDTIMAGDVYYSNSIPFYNDGCDTLFIQDILYDTTVFKYLSFSNEIWPGDVGTLFFEFHPPFAGTFYDTLEFVSNNVPFYMYLQGTAVEPVRLEVDPGNIEVSINCFETVHEQLTLTNISTSTLTMGFSLSAGEDFLSLGPYPDSLLPGMDYLMDVTFQRKSLADGIYIKDIIITTNDPANPTTIIPCTLEVVHPYVVAQLGVDRDICSGANAVLDPGQGFASYLWSNGSNSPTISTSAAGVFSVSVTSQEGCISSDTVEVEVHPNPTVVAGNDEIICQGCSVMLNAVVSGGTLPYTYTWFPGIGMNDPHQPAPSVTPDTTTIYTLMVQDFFLCSSEDSMMVTVNATPEISLSDHYIVEGDSVWLSPSISGGELPYLSYTWTPAGSLSNPGSASTWVNPVFTTTYSISVTGSNGCTGNASATVFVTRISDLYGKLTYVNSANTPLTGTKMLLYKNTGELLDSVQTDAQGHYLFDSLVNGTYYLLPDIEYTWGGVNATDALEIQKHVVGISTLYGLINTAADVNYTGYISSADALITLRRFAGLTSAFDAGDWVFENYYILINDYDVEWNIRSLCVGDVNRSYVPGLKDLTFSVALEKEGTIHVSHDEIFEIPVQIIKNEYVAAISLIMYIPGNIEVVTLESSLRDYIYYYTGNELRFAWQQPNGVFLSAGQEVMRIWAKGRNGPARGLGILAGSELADPGGNVIEKVSLRVPYIIIDNTSPNEDVTLEIYPNPADEYIMVGINLPEVSEVEFSIRGITGNTLISMPVKIYPEGLSELMIPTGDLSPAVYQLCARITGNSHYSTKFLKIVINR